MDSGHPARSGSESTVHGAPTSQPPQLGGDDPKSANEADNEDVQDAAGTVPAGSSLGLSEATTPTPTASAFKANSAQTQAQAQAQPQAQPQASAIHARETTPNRAGTARTQSVQSSGSAHNHATNQAALGRGRAPTLTSHTSTLSTTGSPRSRSSVVLPTMASRPAGQGQGHRSMPSTSASLTFSDAPTSANFGGAGTQTETESVLSGDEGDTGTYGSFAGQPGVRRSKIPLHPSQSQTSNARVGRSGPGGLKPSAVGTAGKGKARLRSTSRAPQSDSSSPEDDDIERRKSVGEDSINVLPVGMKPAAANLPKNDMDDDEVQRRDRGEELVRRRMRERKKEKKEAEKRERKRKDEEIRRERERQNARTQKGTGAAPPLTGRESMLSDMPLLPGSAYEERPSLSRRSTDPTILDKASQSSFSRAGVTSRESSATTGMPIGAYSPTSGQQSSYWPPPPTNSSLLSATPTPQSPFFPPGATQRATSYARSNVSVGRSDARRDSEAADVFSEAEHDEVLDQVPELTTHQGSAAWRDDVARSMREETSNHDEAAGDETEQLGTIEDEEEEDDEDDDDLNEDVEYTLKDRQDAINIEHPFGLPIWKPALYKKDRSVTRNADKDLHQAPSSATERHLIPGNILWAALFGWWMALFGIICAAVLCIVPFGGAKYGRVIWELAGYLFWPFGKYVEKYEESSADDSMKGYDELSEDGDETVYDDPERPRDVEEAGRTWGRRSGNSSASVGTVKKAPSRPDLIDALEDRRPSSAAPAISREAGLATPTALQYKRSVSYAAGTLNEGERTRLLPTRSRSSGQLYGATGEDGKPVQHNSSGSETEVAEGSPAFQKANSFDERSRQFRVRAAGRLAYWTVFYLFVAPMMLFVCILCWGLVFTIPMAKLLWILLCNLGQEPLGLHFRSPSPHYNGNNNESGEGPNGSGMPQLEAGQKAPRHSRKTYDRSRAMGRLVGPDSTILLCTKKALGLKYYKYTIDGTNIIFINLLPLIAFVIFDFFVIAPLVEKHHVGGFLAFISSQATMFVLSLLSVIPLSYFIGMAVASISAQSSIGMGAVINATFGSIIEIILYSIALTQSKGSLVEGSIVGSLLAGVLLMPGLSMIGGAVRRKEQRFNARSAGVTSTMLIMAIIGILTPTLFYEIYGTFQLTCSSCPEDNTPDNFTCRRCFYEHVDPVDDEFYQSHVKALGYYCAILLVFVSILRALQQCSLTSPYSHTCLACGSRFGHMLLKSGKMRSMQHQYQHTPHHTLQWRRTSALAAVRYPPPEVKVPKGAQCTSGYPFLSASDSHMQAMRAMPPSPATTLNQLTCKQATHHLPRQTIVLFRQAGLSKATKPQHRNRER